MSASWQKRRVLDQVVAGARADGWLVEGRADIFPFDLEMSRGESTFRVRLYVWNVTHGGATRDPSEYRIQVTVPGRTRGGPLGIAGRQTLILGWYETQGVVVAFDPARHDAPSAASPSIQVALGTLETAARQGFAVHRRGNDEIALAFKPEYLMRYVEFQAVLHAMGGSPGILTLLENVAAGAVETEDEEVVVSPEEEDALRSLHAEGERAPNGYWALCANPRTYRVQDAIAERETDYWTTGGRELRRGDRLLVWKAAGGESRRGLVALGEVVSDPEMGDVSENPFWVGEARPEQERVNIRYVLAENLPIWLGDSEEADRVLESLAVVRARGGHVFRVDAEHWEAVLALAGGWPTGEEEEIGDAISAVEAAAGRRRWRRPRISAEARRLIERHAVEKAIAYFETAGWTVADVGAFGPYDLLCTRQEASDLHVEVKGTTSDGLKVVLTKNEVRHAEAQRPHVALFICAGIDLSFDSAGIPAVDGGVCRVIDPWDIDREDLVAIGYEYTVPEADLIAE